ncbi:hypothetical protein [Pontibacter amylolyticus]|uniref:HNH endonuclease n=1 Tax=Pontibacter amylolyticus TaxID=1424080 RepID=A0ABQ1W0A5_9BACT|nr:hypothetical protein [Pontibacter amylolyticus]GGG06459.1 hypothetical protein GCM10011323_08960 [Pontibacter amylolyticus]
MNKTCIFCGLTPENKNREHVLPKWLLELTGNPKRTVKIGFDWSSRKELSFSFDSLVFPSCKSCNDKYSLLEEKAKVIVIKILQYDYLDTEDITILLDWFDKVRTGLWIGYQYLSKNALGVDPKFYIDQRIRTKDRLILINDFNNENVGLTLIGVNTPFFHWYPTCFGLIINNKIFTNASTDFLVSHNLGLPFPKIGYVSSEHRMTEFEMLGGRHKLNKRIFRFNFLRPYTILGQAIATPDFIDSNSNHYSNEYVHNYWQNGEKGLGKIFCETNGNLEWLDEDDEVQVDLRPFIKEGKLRVDIQTLKLQNFVFDNFNVSGERLIPEQQENYKNYSKLLKEFNRKTLAILHLQ